MEFNPSCHQNSPPSLQRQPAGWGHSEGLLSSFSCGFCTLAYSFTGHGALLACLSTMSKLSFSFFLHASVFIHLFFPACLHYLTLFNLKSFSVGQSNSSFCGKAFIPTILFFREGMIAKYSPVSEAFSRESRKGSSAGVYKVHVVFFLLNP